MITPIPTPQQPQISPLNWVGDPGQCPKFVGFPTRAGLPAGLIWSGKGEVPAIGARVYIYLNSFGPAEVRAYFHAEGYLGVLCAPDVLPDWFERQNPGVRLVHVFGRELEPYGPPAAPAASIAPQDEEAQLARFSDAVDQAHEDNGNNPGINRSEDWIPDYPPQQGDEDDGLSDDSQDSTEYPRVP